MTSHNSVIETDLYLARASRLLTEAERDEVIDIISSNPVAGSVVLGLRGLRKLRIGLKGRGKRGGGRLIYWFHSGQYPAVLLLVYGKNEKDDISNDEGKVLLKLADRLVSDFGG